MTGSAQQALEKARAALLAGDAAGAQKSLDFFMRTIQERGIPAPEKERVETALADLRRLAEAALGGTRQALDHIATLIESARTLQTYDRGGRRRIASVLADPARRY